MSLSALVMLVLCGNEQLGPPQPFPTRATVVPIDPAPIATATTPGGIIVAWTDSRRAEALSSGPTDPISSDLWLRLYGAADAQLICQQKSPAAAPSLAWFGKLGLVWRHSNQLDRVSLAVADLDAGWGGTGECGVVLTEDAGASGPVIIARPTQSSAAVFWENDGLVHGVDVDARPLPDRYSGSNPGGLEVAGVLHVATVKDGGVVWYADGVSQNEARASTFAFAASQGSVTPGLFLLEDGEPLSFAPPLALARPARGRVFATTLDAPLAFVEDLNGQPFLWRPRPEGSVDTVRGTPVGLAARASGMEGVAFLRMLTGELVGVEFDRNLMLRPARPVVSTSRGLQRRPTLAWTEGEWAVAFEEHQGRWSGVIGSLRFQSSGLEVSALSFGQQGVLWPRVVSHPSGSSFVLHTLEVAPTRSRISPFVPPAPVDLTTSLVDEPLVEGVVLGRASQLLWMAPDAGTHFERLARRGLPTLERPIAGEVQCAAFAQNQFALTRRRGGAMFLAQFSDDTLGGTAAETPLGVLDACVAGRPSKDPIEFGVASVVNRSIVVSVVGSTSRQVVTTGALPRDVRLAPLPNGWLVVWEDADGLEAAVVDEDAPRTYSLDRSGPRLRGRPALASNPKGEAVVAWPALVGDSVTIRARRFVPVATSKDAGVEDAGVEDAGVSPGVDGGLVLDGGVSSGGPPPVLTLAPACGCSSVGAPLLLAVVLLRWRRRGDC